MDIEGGDGGNNGGGGGGGGGTMNMLPYMLIVLARMLTDCVSMDSNCACKCGDCPGGNASFATMQKVSSENQPNLKQQMPNLPAAQFSYLQAQQSVSSTETQSIYEQVQSAKKQAQSVYLKAHSVYLQAQFAYCQAIQQLSPQQMPPPPLPPPPPPLMSMTPRMSGFSLTSSASKLAPPQQLLNFQPRLRKLPLSSQLPSPSPPMSVPIHISASNQDPCSLYIDQMIQQNWMKLALSSATMYRTSAMMHSMPNCKQMLNLQAKFAELQAQFMKLQLSWQLPPTPPPMSVPTQTSASNQVPYCSHPPQQQLQQNDSNLAESGGINRMTATLPSMSVPPQFSDLTSASNQAQEMLNLQAQFEELLAQFSKLQLSTQPTQTWVSNQVPHSLPLQEQLQQNGSGDDDDLQSTAGSG
ncbi:mediator of RNA polymerase II transcription subunit 15-like [Dioscorea cayenensis subsp. rotundata]|uniref:Mediator of RNA polymerase II transcription subunit 15-like n=1 Tax=Dioscorea cayennensis subsp. rotundata TaxID=55577 RepID=A0AB40CXS5_DIOCR|nr:mediator of RNA polymerase II transcription subunit 15-like [Dioscorea cayenensis subsp. rotundata]